jgi:RNA polymerase sigma factor (sigma-70 family)
MAGGRYGYGSGAVVQQIRHLFGGGCASGLNEWQLLHHYAVRRDEAAFAALVSRHGPMVLGVCRRVLDRPEDVEDAYQATFLVLVRKAGALRERGALGTWLYAVALRVAMRARSQAARRRFRERPAGGDDGWLVEGEANDPAVDLDLGPVLDEELSRLPAHYRSAVVLCYLDGLTHEEAARQLGWPVGTVKGRLSRARELLRGRLTRRGVTLSAAALATRLERAATASAVPELWARTAVRAASRSAAGQSASSTGAGAVSATAAALAEGVLWAMSLTHWAAAVAALTVLGAAAGALAQRAADRPSVAPKAAVAAAAAPEPPRTAAATPPEPAGSSDSHTDGTRSSPPGSGAAEQAPAGADMPKAEAPKDSPPPAQGDPMATARAGFKHAMDVYRAGRFNFDTVNAWAQRLAQVEAEEAADPAARARAADDHLARLKTIEALAKARYQNRPNDDLEHPTSDWMSAQYYREQAARRAAHLRAEIPGAAPAHDPTGAKLKADALTALEGAPPKAGAPSPRKPDPDTTPAPDRPKPPAAPRRGAGAGDAAGRDARTQAIVRLLEQPIPLKFPGATPLQELKDYIKKATRSPEFPQGIPIYIDPVGLQEAEKTLDSPVTIDLVDVPLRRTLQLALEQLGLLYEVGDGLIVITSRSNQGTLLGPTRSEPTARLQMQDRAERGEMNPAERRSYIEMLSDIALIERLLGDEAFKGRVSEQKLGLPPRAAPAGKGGGARGAQ